MIWIKYELQNKQNNYSKCTQSNHKDNDIYESYMLELELNSFILLIFNRFVNRVSPR